jgi:hypothetical protein
MYRRALHAVAAVSLIAVLPGASPSQAAAPIYSGPIPQIACDKQSLPETGVQGRVPKAEVDSGRAAKGYRCNTVQVAHFLQTGGFQTHRYVDKAGHDCAYFDSTLLFPRDFKNGIEGLGVYVMDMKDPTHPVHTATLSTPAMLSPHESLRVNQKRGLIVADLGNPGTNIGLVDVWDGSVDCRHPVFQASAPVGTLGHESAFSPDGTLFYVSSTGGHTLTAVDLTNPKLPTPIWVTFTYAAHGMSISDDGNRLYMADTGNPGTPGLTILDVSKVQQHQMQPAVPEISKISWPEVSIPQNALPITIKGHPYIVEVDEYTSSTTSPDFANPQSGLYNPAGSVGAARIIDIADEKHPKVISNMRLAVNQPAARLGDQKNDPGAQSPVQGYAGHYCAVPQRKDPKIVACGFIVSGMRVFNIEDPVKPKEIAYFNGPVKPGVDIYHSGAFAMSAPAFVPSRNEIWYTDGNTGFYVVRLTAGAFAKGPTRISPVVAPPVVKPAVPKPAAPAKGTGSLASTGLPAALPWVALLILSAAVVRRRPVS